jgi:4-hydroxybenzoate polyprenyltransferase
MIKFEHTVFALPFAFIGALLASGGLPAPRQVIWIMVAMVGARSAAMTFNRMADLEYDRINPRTRERALPKGLLSMRFALAFTSICRFRSWAFCSVIPTQNASRPSVIWYWVSR